MLRRALALLPAAAGALFFARCCIRYNSLLLRNDVRLYGDVLFVSISLEFELALLGLLLSLMLLWKIRPHHGQLPYGLCVVFGVLITPSLVGVPLFAWAYAKLLAPILKERWPHLPA